MRFFLGDFFCAPLKARALLGIGIGLGACLSVAAQITPSQERDAASRNEQELLRRQQQEQQLRRQQERSPDVRLPSVDATEVSPLPVETPCFVIQRLEIKNTTGVPVQEFDWLFEKLTESQASDFLGKCIGAQGVAWLIERAHKHLVDRGFVTTRILASPQDMSQGTLVLTLIPGRIRAIRFSEPVDPRANLTTALPMRAGDILNLRDIEQALENLKRVPTAEADIQIQPAQGDEARLGESDLIVSYRQAFPFRLTVTADDSGTRAIGKYQGSITVSLDNALTLNDAFYVTNSNALGGGESGPRGSHATTVHYSVPVGYWTIGATTSTSAYHQTTAGLNGPVLFSGTSENNEIKATRLVMRDSTQKLNVVMRAFQRKSNNYIDDTEVGVQRRVVGGWDGGLNHKVFIQAATLESNLTYKRGTGAFGAIAAPEEGFNEGTSRFALVTADVNLSVPWTWGDQRARYNGTWRIQSNRTPLTQQDRFAIGGRYTVRGFDSETVLSAERGWLWRNDLSFAIGQSAQEFYVGIDHGEVSGASSALLVAQRLTGAVMGFRGTIHKLGYDVFIGAPVVKPDNFRTAGSTAGFSLIASF